jgi:GNAT superfamily N-acetyltransferase
MTLPDFATTMDATWPALAVHRAGPWAVREGTGGGKRVSAASAAGDWGPDDIVLAEQAQRGLGQDRLFVIWPWDHALDAVLEAQGYAKIDPVVGYAAPVAAFAPPQRMTSFPHWPPLQIAREIWAEGHISAARVAVMDRAPSPKTVILGRTADKPSGAAFVALHGTTAMIHAVEVRPSLRRRGAGRQILAAAAQWAAEQGADRLALAVTQANSAARALYASLGMQPVGEYHYRIKV